MLPSCHPYPAVAFLSCNHGSMRLLQCLCLFSLWDSRSFSPSPYLSSCSYFVLLHVHQVLLLQDIYSLLILPGKLLPQVSGPLPNLHTFTQILSSQSGLPYLPLLIFLPAPVIVGTSNTPLSCSNSFIDFMVNLSKLHDLDHQQILQEYICPSN